MTYALEAYLSAPCEAMMGDRALGRRGLMRIAISLLIVACLAGCVAGSNVSHEDSPGAVKRDAGPVLCKDGSTPPCNDRG